MEAFRFCDQILQRQPQGFEPALISQMFQLTSSAAELLQQQLREIGFVPELWLLPDPASLLVWRWQSALLGRVCHLLEAGEAMGDQAQVVTLSRRQLCGIDPGDRLGSEGAAADVRLLSHGPV